LTGIGNEALSSLTGLNSLTSIGGSIVMKGNDTLSSLTGLDNITSIGGSIEIKDNNSLTSITGLDNVSSFENLIIHDNPSLYHCDTESICNYLANPTGAVNIYNNAVGCYNPPEVADACGIVLPCLPYGNYYFFTQKEIDNFTSYYPGCDTLEGDVVIGYYTGSDITNLNGLIAVMSIGGNLRINSNSNLTSLIGLENLTSIEGGLYIGNNTSLTSLTGLDNLTDINGNLRIGFSPASGNPVLTSLAGLDNLKASSIDLLHIKYNTSLSTCEVQSICDYLAEPNGEIHIYGNTTGCNSQEEVELACTVSIEELQLSDQLLIYPNPSSTQITIELPDVPHKNVALSIYNINGQQMLSTKITEQKTVVDISGLPKGLYYIKATDHNVTLVGKLMKN